MLPTKVFDATATDAPWIVSSAVLAEKPEPTIVTVVPTEDAAGLTTVTDVAATVKPTELKPVAAIVWSPANAAVGTLKVTWFVLTNGHA